MKLVALAAATAALLGNSLALHSPDSAWQRAPRIASASAPELTPAQRYFGPYDEVWRVPIKRKDVALTFDDGPYPFYTPLLLHVLERSNVHATFFIIGRCAQQFPELVFRILASGDEVANHTYNHVPLTKLTDRQIEYQIAADGVLLQQFTGEPLSLFRPPHGRFNAHVVTIAHELGYHTIFWSDSADDVKVMSPHVIVKRVLEEASPGGIILLHSGRYPTIEALPVIIDNLRRRGYRFVTVSQLLDDLDGSSDR
jgi:peptidoglycan/xylan/chitin deacetylase (PgdA/CDA1 family)